MVGECERCHTLHSGKCPLIEPTHSTDSSSDPFFMPPNKRDKWAKDQAAKIKQASNIDNGEQLPLDHEQLAKMRDLLASFADEPYRQTEYKIIELMFTWLKLHDAAQRQALRDEVMDLLIEIPVTKINPESDEDLTIQMGENAQNRLLYELRTAISTIFEGKEKK